MERRRPDLDRVRDVMAEEDNPEGPNGQAERDPDERSNEDRRDPEPGAEGRNSKAPDGSSR